MSTEFEIPLLSVPQKFSVSLASVTYNMTLRWNSAGSFWCLDIYDSEDEPIICGIPLITGADLLEAYSYLDFGGQLIVTSDFDASKPPTADNLGTQSHLFFVTTP